MDIVNVPVLVKYLPEVYALLARLGAGETEKPAWTPELVKRAYNESDTNMRNVLVTLKAAKDQWVSRKELCTATKLTPVVLRGVLGAFGHRCKSRYKLGSFVARTWQNGEAHYRIVPVVLSAAF